MAFPSIAAQGSSTDNTSDTSATITLPTGTYTSGDVILVLAGSRAATASSPSTGYNLISAEALNEGDVHVFWKKSDGTESGGTMTFTTSAATKHPGYVYVLNGAADPDTDPPECSSVAEGNSSTPDPPSYTATWATGEDNIFFYAVGFKSPVTISTHPTTPATATDTFANGSTGGGGGCSISGGAFYDTARDTCDPGSATAGGSNVWSAFTIAVRPVAAGGGGITIPLVTHHLKQMGSN